MNRRKAALLINSLVFLFSVLFLNSKKISEISSNISNVGQVGIEITPEVLSQDSGMEIYAKVIKMIDGDTIELGNGERVRYIGIDSPERLNGGECYYQEALEKNSELVLGKSVRLVNDISEADKYHRLLKYVYVGDVFVNELLVREGYAAVVA